MIQVIIAKVLVKIGSFLCATAIKMSGQGYMNIEVANMNYNHSFTPESYVNPNPEMNSFVKKAIGFIFIGMIAWAGLELAISMELLLRTPC